LRLILPIEGKNNSSIKAIFLHTSDGGQSWQSVSVGEKEPFFERIYFVDTQLNYFFIKEAKFGKKLRIGGIMFVR
jgi:hypothetical protein